MPDRDGYIAGVPCWIDTTQPDPDAAAEFYGALFGWQLEDTMPEDAPGKYYMARIRGRDAAAVSSQMGEDAQPALWNTYIQVDSADATAEKVKAAGGSVMLEPFDIFDSGRMAFVTDPQGAAFGLWQPNQHIGTRVDNEHGAINFNDLHTDDIEGAKAFYGEVFGWGTLEMGGGNYTWTLKAYGDLLEERNPGQRERMKEMGAPDNFSDVVASLGPVQGGAPPSWGVTFGVDDADAIATKARELGGEVLAGPFDAPWVRLAVIRDPQGATFTAGQFVLENKDIEPAPADAAA
jgi:predicted enzyme related to lactoylglutathione lyase